MNTILFFLLYGIIWLITLLPYSVLYCISSFIAFLLYYVIPYRRNLVIKNLSCTFPTKDIREITSIAKKFYVHFVDNILESCMILNMSKKEAFKRMIVKNPEMLDPYFKAGKSILGVCSHYGTWDLLLSLPLQVKHPFIAFYKPINNKTIDKIFIRLRKKFGVQVVPINQTLQTILKNKDKNDTAVYVFIADQRPVDFYIRYWTEFLNQETPILLGVEKISKKTNFPVLYLDVQKVKRGHYEVEFKIVSEDPSSLSDMEIVENYLKLMESRIIEKPEYWLWSHDRWKHNRANWEKRYGHFIIEKPKNQRVQNKM
jgi:Kdo2-lipid IVA lauroyltransferase/acyltransferase